MASGQIIEMRRDDFTDAKAVARDFAPAEGEALLHVESFAMTANNVTYAVTGERIGYWSFFPAGEEGRVVTPVWGAAEVVESRADALAKGDRIFGFLPMASHAILEPEATKGGDVVDRAAHRQPLPGLYNRYRRLTGPAETRGDAARAVLWPLLATSYALADYFRANDWFGAARVIVTSASARTSLGLARAIRGIKGAPRTLGLTSPRNAAAVRDFAFYDDVMTYDQADAIPEGRAVIVDIAGDGELLTKLHVRLSEDMAHTALVGRSHKDAPRTGPGYQKDKAQFFFAPSHIADAMKAEPKGAYAARADAFFRETEADLGARLTWRHAQGADALLTLWAEMCANRVDPREAWTAAL